MKSYPHILNSKGTNFRQFTAYVFDKIDGSNLRFEYSRKRGWYKFGTRNRLFDETDDVFGPAKVLFLESMGKEIQDMAKYHGWDSIVAFAEFAGPNSFAGKHVATEAKELWLFDIALNKKGILGPSEFLTKFSHCHIPHCLGRYNWTREFVEQVRLGQIQGITFEGCVGKSGEGHDLIMAKAKTQAWIDKVKAQYSQDEAEKIINS